MLYQFMQSHQLKVRRRLPEGISTEKMDKSIEPGAIFVVRDGNEKFQVSIEVDELGQVEYVCNCKYCRGTQLHCSHIFAVLTHCQV